MKYGVQRKQQLIGLALLFIFGCMGEGPPPAPQQAEPEFTCRGIITATTTRFISESEEPFEQFEFMAMFPRYQDLDQNNVDALLPTHVPQSDLQPDTCSRPEPRLTMKHKDALSKKNAITLVDAGDIFVQLGRGQIPISTRTFPDLLKIINGVIYTANPGSAVDFVPGQAYTIKTRGTDNIGSFEVVLDAPNDLGDVKVDDISPSLSTPSITKGRPIALTWEGEGYGDEVILEMNWTGLGLSWNLSCRMKDDGRFVIPAELTEHMISSPTSQTHEMSLSRLRQVSFAASGISFGDFSFVATTSFLVDFNETD